MDNRFREHLESCPKPKPGTCGLPTEVYSRVVGYHRPVKNWNDGKKEEFKDRREFLVQKSLIYDNGGSSSVRPHEEERGGRI